ncbi:TolC family protein [Hellea sp.]|nr:TolC family protein [Hellea sp.]
MKSLKNTVLRSLRVSPLLCLAACASIDVPPAPAVAPAEATRAKFEYAIEDTIPVTPTWWRQFDDQLMVSLVEKALAENRTLEAARANLGQADATLKRARLAKSYQTGSIGDLALEKNSVSTAFDLNASGALSASWEIDVFGRVEALISSAEFSREAALQSKRDIAVLVASQTAQAYVDLRGAQQRLEVAEESAELQDESLDLLRELADAGRSNDLDFNRAESLFLTTKASLPTFRASVETARTRLAALTGVAVGDLALDAPLLMETRPIPRHSGALSSGTPAELLRRRPDIREAEARISEQLALGEIERSRLFPVISFDASLNNILGTVGNVTDFDSFGFGIGPSLSWEGPDLRRVRADIEIADLETRETFALYEQTVLDALAEVESSLASYRRELERRDDLMGASEAAANALRLARLRFQEGIDDFLDVLDAQRTLLDTRDDIVQNDIAITTFAISAYRAFGGMWSDEELQNTRFSEASTAQASQNSNAGTSLESQPL